MAHPLYALCLPPPTYSGVWDVGLQCHRTIKILRRGPLVSKSYLTSLSHVVKRAVKRMRVLFKRAKVFGYISGLVRVLGRTAILAAIVCLRPLVLFECFALCIVVADVADSPMTAASILLKTFCVAYGLLLAAHVLDALSL
ncbi:uncharacterized protein PHACADRAFT_211356 [Phanerochaete carnosa HHB-10118-sp]|uniref:Uncharacterized protein n=1 Tax=Phanerochaete carnosa (strain HHB-10118-sp) TaxID=650164 RepID=K5UUJ5_PHACS|nr:uncharacterized protein PHACADRAFT_211356 [Phanerochaete carnosa HHB-10118-sp]EKM53686.1 hypothetical protein PHACADRAFT_211356 [Phanerochaete carnosa HHB-10118-sp]